MARWEVGGGLGSALLQLYGAGMLGGEPARLRKAKTAEAEAKVAELGKQSAAKDRPVYKTEPVYEEGGDPNWDVAQGGTLPQTVKTPGKEGMSIRQLQEFGKGLKEVPISALLQTKAGKGLVEPFMKLIFPGKVAEEAVGPGMYRSTEGIKAEEMAGMAATAPEGDPDFLPNLERLFGTREKIGAKKFAGTTKGGTIQTAGEGAAGKFIEQPTITGGTEPTSVREWRVWKTSLPKDYKGGTSFGDYTMWKVTESAEAKRKALFGDMSDTQKKALDTAKATLALWIDSNLGMAGELTPDQIQIMLMEQYRKNLRDLPSEKASPEPEVGGRVEEKFRRKEGERLDVKSIQKAIDAQKAKKR